MTQFGLGKTSRADVWSAWTRERATPLTGGDDDFDAVIALIGDARVVMLGEASHGTSEFYVARARLTRRLVAERGFSFVAIEGDWPDAALVDRYVRGGTGTAEQSLEGFRRFPTWMWRNRPVLDFVAWLRSFNDGRPASEKVGFHGLDVYSLHSSIAAVLGYLDRTDPKAAAIARERYACLAPFEADTQQYALSAHYLDASCEEQVLAVLQDLRARQAGYAASGGEGAFFDAEMNALAAANAESYYRRMVHGGATTWNLRDRHMAAVLNRLLARSGPGAKAVVWEHNSHIGDFRATHEGESGYLNVGQLVREQFGEAAVAVGYGTYQGTVTAASAWDGPVEFKRVPPARAGSYESVFHDAGHPAFYLSLKTLQPAEVPDQWLYTHRDERAIGVVYEPSRERYGNYVPSMLARRYDAYFFYDTTLAVEPLDTGSPPPGLEAYPTGI